MDSGSVRDRSRKARARLTTWATRRCSVAPAEVVTTALVPGEKGGVLVRVLNASDRDVEATLRPGRPVREAFASDPLEKPLSDGKLAIRDGAVRLPLRPWQIATVVLR